MRANQLLEIGMEAPEAERSPDRAVGVRILLVDDAVILRSGGADHFTEHTVESRPLGGGAVSTQPQRHYDLLMSHSASEKLVRLAACSQARPGAHPPR